MDWTAYFCAVSLRHKATAIKISAKNNSSKKSHQIKVRRDRCCLYAGGVRQKNTVYRERGGRNLTFGLLRTPVTTGGRWHAFKGSLGPLPYSKLAARQPLQKQSTRGDHVPILDITSKLPVLWRRASLPLCLSVCLSLSLCLSVSLLLVAVDVDLEENRLRELLRHLLVRRRDLLAAGAMCDADEGRQKSERERSGSHSRCRSSVNRHLVALFPSTTRNSFLLV